MGWVLPTGRDELRVGCGGHIQYERTCVFICACECGTHVYSTRIGSGHGCILPTGRGVRPEFILRLVRHIFASVRAVQCSAWAVQAVQAVHLVCVCVCTAVGMCSPNVVPLAVSTCMRALYSIWHGGLGGVRSVHECYLHVCTVRVPLEQCLAWLARGCTYLARACTRTMLVLVLCLYSYCACTRTVIVLVLSLYHCTVCIVLVPLVQCSGMASTGNVPTCPHCPRTVLVTLHSVYCACIFCTVVWPGQHGQCTCLARVCTRTVVVPLLSV